MAHRDIPNASPFACIGKEAHASGQMAARVARAMKRKGKSVESYLCKHCQYWHVGRGHRAKIDTPRRGR